MSYTKRQFVDEAFAEIGLGIAFDLQSDQLQFALRRLDGMMAMWNGRGIRIGYPLPSSPENSSLDEETGVQDSANEAIYTNLALRIAPSFGKVIVPDTKITARLSFNELQAKFAQPIEQQLPQTLPRGAGQKTHRRQFNRFFPKPVEPLLAGPDSELEFD